MAVESTTVDPKLLESVDNGYIKEDFPSIKISDNEEIINKNKNHNASIIIGRDRPGGLSSGYGKYSKDKGGGKSSTIDIVAGRYSKKSETIDEYEVEKGKKEKKLFNSELLVGNNFNEDASRIYISQKTDIDKNFLIEKMGSLVPSVGKAGIGIKSDNVRIIGRESVKIVAKTGEENSLGEVDHSVDGKNNICGIQLITGNGTEYDDVQYIAKADNLEKCLKDILDKLSTFMGLIDVYVKAQTNFNNAIAAHEHAGHFRSDIAGAVQILQPQDLLSAFSKYSNDISSITIKDIDSLRKSLGGTKNKYLKQGTKLYIGSRFNKTN